jgi:type II secretory pathway pseudopilin PulG
MKNHGMVLLTTLIILMIMLLLVSSSLFISQLSLKSAQAAQQQLQLDHQAQAQHLRGVKQLAPATIEQGIFDLPTCPGVYAAWSDTHLQCELLLLETSLESQAAPLITRYNSLVLRKRVRLPEGK